MFENRKDNCRVLGTFLGAFDPLELAVGIPCSDVGCRLHRSSYDSSAIDLIRGIVTVFLTVLKIA